MTAYVGEHCPSKKRISFLKFDIHTLVLVVVELLEYESSRVIEPPYPFLTSSMSALLCSSFKG